MLSLPWRKADANTRTLCESTPGAAGWVSEGSASPGSKLNLATVTLERGTKIAGLVFLSNEVLELWTSATSSQLNRALVNVVGRYVDVALLDPNLGAVAGLRPASLTNGATRISSPAATEAGVTTAVKAALQVLADGGGDLRNAVLVMSPSTALSVSTLLTAGNIRAFPNVGVRGGEVFGVPVVTTTGAASQGSPTENLVVAIDPSQVLLADSGDVEFSTSRQAALQMDNAPGAGAQSSVSLYQTGTTAIKFVRQLNFEKCHSSATSFFTTTF